MIHVQFNSLTTSKQSDVNSQIAQISVGLCFHGRRYKPFTDTNLEIEINFIVYIPLWREIFLLAYMCDESYIKNISFDRFLQT